MSDLLTMAIDVQKAELHWLAQGWEPLTVREDPAAELRQRELTLRTFAVRAASLDESSRSVEAIFATEEPVQVMDWQRYEVIDEVLRMDGAELPDQVPMLECHARYSLGSVFGSARQLRIEGPTGVGRLYFGPPSGDKTDPVERAYQMVKGGHLRDVSAGYRSLEYVDIPAGQSATVKGRTYTAGQRTLRVTTKWQLREVSLVPIGADQRSKIRAEHPESIAMNPQLRAFLETIGLRKEATDAEAQAFYGKLNAADKARADAAQATPPPAAPVAAPAPAPAAATPTTRSETTPPAAPVAAAAPAAPVGGTDAVRQAAEAAVAAERDRVRQINELAGTDVPEATRRQAVEEGWSLDRCRGEFLTAVRGARQNPAPAMGGGQWQGGVHVRANPNALALGLGLALRESPAFGTNLPERYREFHEGNYRPVANPNQNQDLLRAADAAWQFRHMSMVDFVREACRLDFGRVPSDPSEAFRTAVSGSTLSAIFTTNVNAQFLSGWEEAADSTLGWCSESDVPNFLTQERAQMGKSGKLTKLARGKKADHLDTDDKKEEYKIARFAGQLVVDDQDIINDRFGAIDQSSPSDMGSNARSLRPDLVYAILLANAALSDTVALFHATHGNLGSGALNAANLKALITLMGQQRMGRANDAAAKKRVLNVVPRFLIVPQDLVWTALELMQSTMIVLAGTAGTVTERGNANVLANLMQVRGDDRVGTNGCWDPNTETVRAGSATNYFIAARPGENGAKTIEVGYRRGTGRVPQIRSFVLDKGQWGLGWDVSYDIGAKALDHKGVAKSPGT